MLIMNMMKKIITICGPFAAFLIGALKIYRQGSGYQWVDR